MILKWLAVFFVSLVGLFIFNWCFYSLADKANVWFVDDDPYTLYLCFAAANMGSILLVFYLKWRIWPSHWDAIGLSLYVCIALLVLYLNTYYKPT